MPTDISVTVQPADHRGRTTGSTALIVRRSDEQEAEIKVDRGVAYTWMTAPKTAGRALLRAVNPEARPRSICGDFVDDATGEIVARIYDVFEARPRPVQFGQTSLPAGTYRAAAYVGHEGPETVSSPRFQTQITVRVGETTIVDVR